MNAQTPQRKQLSSLQITALRVIGVAVVLVGAGGAYGTFHNMAAVFGNDAAWGIVAASEGATLMAAMIAVGLTVLEQPVHWLVRFAMIGVPVAAASSAFFVAPTRSAAVAFAVTQLAMVVAAEGGALLARSAVTHVTGIDPTALKRNADIAQRLNYHFAASEQHPSRIRRWLSLREAWRLARHAGAGDNALAEGLVVEQRARIVQGAGAALGAMFGHAGSAVAALPAPAATPALTAGVADGSAVGVAFGRDQHERGVGRTVADGASAPSAAPAEPPAATMADEVDHGADDVQEPPAAPVADGAEDVDGDQDQEPEQEPSDEEPADTDRPRPPLRQPAADDDELYRAGFELYRRLGPPRTQNRFVEAMRADGHKGADKRLIALYKRIQHEVNELSVEAITGGAEAQPGS
ncbi:hypothetical protein [Streptomyces sp. NBC_01439]|uniref:hypothetical protein n=1 Tax=Streptomyces sp. NBC_01439 TaxID=2903867 RepID=UPI002E2D9971|nr:hypothetical protein [Streptomyces sp. NBC_01439]